MRKIIIILFLFITSTLYGVTYYVSNSGSDAAVGTSEGTAWATINKVNSEWSNINAGDKVLFRRGDVFTGMLNVTKSGEQNNHIIIGSYGSGALPVFTGFTIVTDWEAYSGNIQRKTVTTESMPQILIRNNKNIALGRWPKGNYGVVESATTTSLTDSNLPASPNYNGGQVVMRPNAWTIQKRDIISHSDHTLNYSQTVSYPMTPGWGYFIQNHINVLTQANDWAYINGVLYYYQPTGEIKISSQDVIIQINGYNYITIDGIHLEGANTQAITLNNSHDVLIRNSVIENCGSYGIRGITGISYVIVNNCRFKDINNMGIKLEGSNCTITNNTVRRIGIWPGMGWVAPGDLDHALIGMEVRGATGGHIISYNKVDSTGYDGISFGGTNTEVSYNTVGYFCFVKDDGGGIYSFRDYNEGKVVKFNFCHHGVGIIDGEPSPTRGAHGIYNDGSTSCDYLNNVCWANADIGIFANNEGTITIKNNLLYDNHRQLALYTKFDQESEIENNIMIAREYLSTYRQSCMTILNTDDVQFSNYGISDNNYFARPIFNDEYIEAWYNAYQAAHVNRHAVNLAGWQSLSGQDLNSTASNITVSSLNELHFIFNNSSSAKSYTLTVGMKDIMGVDYSGSIELQPWTALVLIGEGSVIEVMTGGMLKDASGVLLKSVEGTLMRFEGVVEGVDTPEPDPDPEPEEPEVFQRLGVAAQSVDHGSEEMFVKVDLCSDVEWVATSSEEWLKVGTQRYWKVDSGAYVTFLYSGTAPDLGAFEYLDVMVAGHDSAFLYLIAEENTGEERTAIVTITSDDVEGVSQIAVTQAAGAIVSREGILERRLYVNRHTRELVVRNE